jgi:hypothetical protein
VPRILVRISIAALAILAGAVAGLYVSLALAPGRLREVVEAELEDACDSPVEIATLRLVVGFPIHLSATGLVIWDGALRIDNASARLDVLSLLTGRIRLSRLQLAGAHFTIARSRGDDGSIHWSPPPFQDLADRNRGPSLEPALVPLEATEATVRFLLERPRLADALEVRRSRVTFLDDQAPDGRPYRLWLAGVHGRLTHSRLRGDAELFVRMRLSGPGGGLGSMEWEGSRTRDGELRIALAATDVELAALEPYAYGAVEPVVAHGTVRAPPRLRGRLSGLFDFETAGPGEGRLDLDLYVRDFETRLDAGSDAPPRPVRVERLAVAGSVGLDAGHVELARTRLEAGDLSFGVDAVIERPLRRGSNAGITLSLRDIDLSRGPALVGWLPRSLEAPARGVAEAITGGRIVRLEARGAAPLHVWGDVVSGRPTERLPRSLRVEAQVEGLGVAVGETDRLDGLAGSLTWTGDRVEVKEAVGELNGASLPAMEITVLGISELLASDAKRRLVPSGAGPLPGLVPLWEFLTPEGGPASQPAPAVRVHFDHLDHAALLWPFDDMDAFFEPFEDGIHVAIERALWAGVPLRGAIDATLRPTPAIAARFEVGPEPGEAAPARRPVEPEPAENLAAGVLPWASGHFELGAIETGVWAQRETRGHFAAVRGELHFEGVETALDPSGTVQGSASMDLSHEDEVPWAVSAFLEGGVASLLAQAGFADLATGTVAMSGGVAGSLRPGRPLFADFAGLLTVHAVDGTVRRSVPPLLAVAMASESLAFSRREKLRFDRADTVLRFDDGVVATDAFELQGRDLRLFASGTLDLTGPQHTIDAEVVLFLFRQIDRAIVNIPILNDLLLGDNENLLAAYFELVGPWEDPVAEALPLRTFREGPLIGGIPRIVRRSVEAIGGLLRPPPSGFRASPPASQLGTS